jgi:hypothetical protein
LGDRLFATTAEVPKDKETAQLTAILKAIKSKAERTKMLA